MTRARKAPIPVTIVVGPRGAGKTRLVNRALASPLFANTAVILNDFGQTALTGASATTAEDDVMALGAGCVCCTVRGALSAALENLLRDLDNRRLAAVGRVVIEAAATADPAAVIAQIARHPYLSLRFTVDGIVAVVGAQDADATLANNADAVRQLAMADVIAVSGAAEGLTDRLAALNPFAAIVDAAELAPEDLVGHDGAALMADEIAERASRAASTGEAGRINVFFVRRRRRLSMAALDRFLDYLAMLQSANLLRLAGLVAIEGGEMVSVAGIGGLFYPPAVVAWEETGETRFVVSARDFDRATFEAYLDAFLNEARVDTPDRAALTDNPLAIAGFSARPGKR